ncbi:hypothetical protein ACFX15_006485 [Malus domestica]
MLPKREGGVASPAIWPATRATLHDDANAECPGTCMWAQQSHVAPPAPQLPQPPPMTTTPWIRYLMASNIIDHPLFKELADRSDDDTINVACKVMLFEYLLWML